MEKNEIAVVYGTDPVAMARQLAEACGLAGLVGGPGKSVGLKPNLVLARPADEGATTHPEIAEGLIQYLQKAGVRDIRIIEGSWVGDSTAAAFPVCGYTALAENHGVRLIDTQGDSYRQYDCAGMRLALCDAAMDVDFMINLPVMKGHCQTGVTCALKNNKGVIPDPEKRRFHSMGLHKPIAHLNTRAKNDFIMVDGICGDLDFEEGGNPLPAGRMFAGRDPVLIDAYAARLMGFGIDEIPYIGLAQSLGVGSADLSGARVCELNSGSAAGAALPTGSRKAARYIQYIRENAACSACYAALVRALSRSERDVLGRLPKQGVCIGQGWRGKGGPLGVGACAAGCARHLGGCPPSAAEILDFLRENA